MPDFSAALKLVLKYEGGKVNDPRDPGGRTAYGITQATFSSYCKANGATPRDVWTITPSEVEAIYRNEYAAAVHFDDLPNGVGFCVLDAAINSGPKRGAQWLQAALGVTQDGAIGPKTLAAAKAASAFTLINTMCDVRLAFLRSLEIWPTYKNGWTTRVEDVRKNATAMARAAPAPTIASAPSAPVLNGIIAALNAAAKPVSTPPRAPLIPPVVAPPHILLPAAPKGWFSSLLSMFKRA